MLILKGSSVRLEIGRRAVLVGSMLHDPDGNAWPACSFLCAKFSPGGRDATDEELKGAPRDYFGKNYRARVGKIELPPRNLSSWEFVGDVTKIWYTRPGTKAPGRFVHKINSPRGLWKIIFFLKGRGEAKLYKRGKYFRLDFSAGCLADDRGVAYP
jgi:hypothetical protein